MPRGFALSYQPRHIQDREMIEHRKWLDHLWSESEMKKWLDQMKEQAPKECNNQTNQAA